MDDKLKWMLAAGGLGFVGFAVWQFMRETGNAVRAAGRERKPWEIE
ncbi:MAG: hypothetical protein L0241_07900 [Planctomycetia bacterium]|nr:hypothetical protein [Planctomycetia bacterium]